MKDALKEIDRFKNEMKTSEDKDAKKHKEKNERDQKQKIYFEMFGLFSPRMY